MAICLDDALIKSHCHVSTGAIVNGGTLLGEGLFMGSHAMSLQDNTIGENCIIGEQRKRLNHEGTKDTKGRRKKRKNFPLLGETPMKWQEFHGAGSNGKGFHARRRVIIT